MTFVLTIDLLLLAARGVASDYTSGLACSADGKLVFMTRVVSVFARSTNSGMTWQTNPPSQFGWDSLACSADGARLVAGAYAKIYTSPDSGQTWNGYDVPPTGWNAAACSADGSQIMVASTDGLVLTSTNAGTNWRTNALPAWRWVAVAASANGNKLAAAAATVGSFGTPSGIFTSTNGGISWIQNDVPAGLRWVSVACSADGARLVAGATLNQGVFLSTNSGANWTKVTNGPPHGAARCSADGSTVVVASFGDKLYRSTNFGETWTYTSPTNILYPVALATSADGSRVYVSALDSGSDRIEFRQFPVNPTLKLSRLSESTLALSWTVPSSNFIVERASEPLRTNWSASGVTPILTNYDYQIALSSNIFPSVNPQYFRLRSIP